MLSVDCCCHRSLNAVPLGCLLDAWQLCLVFVAPCGLINDDFPSVLTTFLSHQKLWPLNTEANV